MKVSTSVTFYDCEDGRVLQAFVYFILVLLNVNNWLVGYEY